MKEYLQKLCSQLEKDFEILMSKAAEEKKSAHILAVEAVSLKRKRDEKLKEIEKLDEVIENMGKHKKMHMQMLNLRFEVDEVYVRD